MTPTEEEEEGFSVQKNNVSSPPPQKFPRFTFFRTSAHPFYIFSRLRKMRGSEDDDEIFWAETEDSSAPPSLSLPSLEVVLVSGFGD